MILLGHIHDGKVVLDTHAVLPNGTPVSVFAEVAPVSLPTTPTSFLERYKSVIGAADDPDLPADGALNHDHYLYGLPKKV